MTLLQRLVKKFKEKKFVDSVEKQMELIEEDYRQDVRRKHLQKELDKEIGKFLLE